MNDAARDESIHRADGRQISWREFGDPCGWPLIYCHGMPGSRLEAALFARAAAFRGLRLIAPDRPGYGDTSSLPARALGDEVVDIEAVIDTLEVSRFDVLGFSGGGPHAMVCAARLPDRVRRVGLVSTLAPLDRVGTDGMTDGLRQLWDLAAADFPAFEQALGGAVAVAGDAYELVLGGAPVTDRAILRSDAVADPYRQSLAEAMRQGLAGMLGDARALAGPWSFDIKHVAQSTSIWHGVGDTNVPIGMGRFLERSLPDARLIEWPGAAHFEAFRRQGEVLEGFATY